MAKIEILEDNLTQVIESIGTDIPYIPGFMGRDKDGEALDANEYTVPGNPFLCTTIYDFEKTFGYTPYYFTENLVVDGQIIAKSGTPDKSYIMAKELLSQGMPVLYHACPLSGKYQTSGTSIIEDLYLSNGGDEIVDGPFYIDPTHIPFRGTLTTANNILTREFKIIGTSDSKGNKFKPIFTTNNQYSNITIDYELEGMTLGEDTLYTWTGSNQEGTITIIIKPSGSITEDIKFDFIASFYLMDNGSAEDTSSLGDNFKAMLEEALSINELDGILIDKNEYTFKYLTTGGYPNYWNSPSDFSQKMINLAATRGDCVACLESLDDNTKPLTGPNSIIDIINGTTITNGSYGTIFYPWSKYNLRKPYNHHNGSETVEEKSFVLPATFGYLTTLALNIKTSPNWLAMAGVTRGLVPNLVSLNTSKVLSNIIADHYQPSTRTDGYTKAVNAITNIKPYGYSIWGNRTLATIGAGLDASHFLSIRNMISDIKKVAYQAAKSLKFEQDGDVLWLNLKAEISPFLDQLKGGNGISDYKLIRTNTKYNGDKLGKQQLACAIKIYAVYPIEEFEITIVVSDNDIQIGG